MSEGGKKGGIFTRFLDAIEWLGNKLPHPVTLFAVLALITILLSGLLAAFGVSVEHPGEPGETVAVRNLLSAGGITYIFESAVENFIGFAPLGVVLATMLGIGLAERSGLISAALRGFVTSVPDRLITATLVFAGIMSSVASDAGYVVLPPLGALLFLALGRHPLAGLAAAFAGASAGFSANLLLSATDPLLGALTIEAAATIDPDYAGTMNYAMNYYFIIVSTFILTIAGTWVTEKIVEPRLGRYRPDDGGEPDNQEAEEMRRLRPEEKRGLVWAGLSFAVTIIAMALLVVPEWGPMRGEGESPIVDSPFMASLAILIAIAFFIPGLVYGVVTGAIRSDKDVAGQLSDTMAAMGMFIVLAFTAGQFVAYFNETNMGLVIGVYAANFLESIQFTGLPLLLAFIVVSGFINLFIGSASAKWAMMAPVFVPIMMQLGYSPELTQMAYRIADSTTNIITPLMTYFAIIIAFAQRYDRRAGIGTLVAMMLPYTLIFSVVWTLQLILWVLLELPLGPGSSIFYP
jgi:aminobenzoyl-glutamate transport protein